jgi:hypothetical protein
MKTIMIENGPCRCAMCDQWNVTSARVLESMEPDAKRDLAAQLLQSANEAEGHPEGAPNEDGADGGTL